LKIRKQKEALELEERRRIWKDIVRNAIPRVRFFANWIIIFLNFYFISITFIILTGAQDRESIYYITNKQRPQNCSNLPKRSS
jgi:hypothetical protein